MFLLGIAIGALLWPAIRLIHPAAHPTEIERDSLAQYRIDLNTASRSELLQLPGMGSHLADRVEAYRREHGGFRQVEDLRQVPGIGVGTIERWRSSIWAAPGTGEIRNAAQVPPSRPGTLPPSSSARKTEALARQGLAIDLNRASEEELQRLPGIGPKMAERIVAERAVRPFRGVEELRRVKGIGPKTLARLRPFLTATTEAAPALAASVH